MHRFLWETGKMTNETYQVILTAYTTATTCWTYAIIVFNNFLTSWFESKKTRLKSTEHFHILLCSGTKLHPQVEGDKNDWSHSTYRRYENAYQLLVRKLKEITLSSSHRWEDNTEIDLKDQRCEGCILDSHVSGCHQSLSSWNSYYHHPKKCSSAVP